MYNVMYETKELRGLVQYKKNSILFAKTIILL